jgi:FixJ family two-component response regulator
MLPVFTISDPSIRMPASRARGFDYESELTMHASDVFLECSREIARLSHECGDEQISAALFEISARLLSAATRNAGLVTEDGQAASQRALRTGLPLQGPNVIKKDLFAGAQAVPDNTDSKGEIFVMDGDAVMRETLTCALKEEGYELIRFADGAALLSLASIRMPVCIFIEVRHPGKGGFDVLKKLRAEDYPAPIFVISEQGDIVSAVDAIKIGAFDFIAKPIDGSEIVALVKAAIGSFSQLRPALYLPGRRPLTHREREVLARMADGISNKEVARQLGVSSRTIEGHRANIMKKVGVRNVAELIRRLLGKGIP